MQCIGWVILDRDGLASRPLMGRGWYQRRKPTTVYQSQKRAEGLAREGQRVVEVFIEEDN